MIAAWLKKQGRHFGSIRLAGHKELSNQNAVRHFEIPAGMALVLPLQQHAGEKPELNVQVGDYVCKGQPLAKAEGNISVPIHASTSGTIIAIAEHPIPHPSGLNDRCVILQADGLDISGDSYLPAMPDYQQYDGDTLRQRIRAAGIVGLGGAVFPSAIKLKTHQHIPVDTLIINGAECEPYITCDEALMRDKADQILAGAQIMRHILQSDKGNPSVHCLIGIEDNKAQAIRVMQEAVGKLDNDHFAVVVVPTQYPAGGEKQLIHQLTAREVPSAGRPADIGVICHNVATSRAIYRAVVLGEPLISRYVTVTGDGVNAPCNVEVALGVRVSELVEGVGGYAEREIPLVPQIGKQSKSKSTASLPPPSQPSPARGAEATAHCSRFGNQSLKPRLNSLPPLHQTFPEKRCSGKGWGRGEQCNSTVLTMGGPMMGIPLHSDQIPVVKATNCILVNNTEPKPEAELPCIRCGKCADHCPAGLLPQQLYWYAKAKDFAKTEDYQLFDCIECGCCSYVCPSHIPLVDYYRFAKTDIRAQRQAKDKAELARERHDFHNERIERAKRERIERLAKHKKKAVAGNKKDAIQAALERAKAKKAQATKDKQQAPDSGPGERRERRRRRRDDSAPKPDSQEAGQ